MLPPAERPSGPYPPPSVVTARFATLARTPRTDDGQGGSRQALITSSRATDHMHPTRHYTLGRATLAAARWRGGEPVQTEPDDRRLDAAGCPTAGDVPIDVVLLEAAATASCATAEVLAWLHEGAHAGLLTPTEQDSVRSHVLRAACPALNADPAAQLNLLRAPRSAAPAGGTRPGTTGLAGGI